MRANRSSSPWASARADASGEQGNGHPGGTDVEPPSSPADVDNAKDKHSPDLPHARSMCAAYPHLEFFCGQVADSEQDDGQ